MKNKIKTLTYSELIKFIRSQPNNRKIDMGKSWAATGSIGCVLVHFARYMGKKGKIIVGFSSIRGVKTQETDRDNISTLICLFVDMDVKNYKQAKDLLKTIS